MGIPKIIVFILVFLVSSAQAQNLQFLDSISKEKSKWTQIGTGTASTTETVPEVYIFWTSWCEYCKELLTDVSKLKASIPGSKFEVYPVSLDDNIDLAKTVVKDMNWKQAMYYDSEKSIRAKYKISEIPFTVVLDSAKKPKRAVSGYSGEKMNLIRKSLLQVLKREIESE